ncbi:MAG: helix-turn-helix domain-containing protein [Proteobacteria bacterium]|nr:helix-turn-helix domain-containing protein [Pseudomonadota bacterium]
MQHWTMPEVATRFEQAVKTLRRLPSVKVKGYFNVWPTIIRTTAEQLGMEVEPLRMGPPSAEAIDEMEETIQWIFLLDNEEERRLIWLRAARVPWRPICWRLGVGRTTAYHMWKVALLKIVTRLNVKRNGGRNGRK